MIDVKTTISFEEIFGNAISADTSETEIAFFLEKIGRYDAVIWCCKINALLSNVIPIRKSSPPEMQLEILSLVGIQDENEEIEIKIKTFINENRLAFNKLQTYSLLPYITKYCREQNYDGESFVLYPKLRIRFFKALVLAGENALNKHAQIIHGENQDELALYSRILARWLDLSRNVFTSIDVSEKIFSRYFKMKIENFEATFFNIYKMSLSEYYETIFYLIAVMTDENGLVLSKIVDNGFYLNPAIRDISIQKGTLITEMNFSEQTETEILLKFYDKPFLYTKKGGVIFFDINRVIDAIEAGIIFDIEKKLKIKHDEIFGKYGESFESYIVDQLKDKFIKKVQIFYDEEQIYDKIICKNKDKKIDAYIDYGTIGIAIEIKAGFINEDKLDTAENFKAEYLSKFGKAKKQLETFAKDLSNSTTEIANKVDTLIPVIIARDSLANAPLSQAFLGKIDSLEGLKVKKPILITLDEFEFMLYGDLNWASFLLDYDIHDKERKANIHGFAAIPNIQKKYKLNFSKSPLANNERHIANINAKSQCCKGVK